MKAICPKCNSTHLRKKGIVYSKGYETNMQRYACYTCKKQFQVPKGSTKTDAPKILLFDIETSPMEVFVWTLIGNKYIQPNNIIKDWNVISWAAKWLCDSTVTSDIQTPEEAIARDDSRVLQGIWKLMDEADILIAQNGDNFDIKKLNTRYILNKIGPPSPYQSIDTLKVSKRNFAMSSNKLDFLVQKLTDRKGKLKTDFELWKSCLRGDPKALKYMEKYNKEDVFLLEDVYLEFRPWIKSHPNFGIYMDTDDQVCPTCGSDDIKAKGSYYTTAANRYKSYNCNNCGAYSRSLAGAKNIEERRILLRSVPR